MSEEKERGVIFTPEPVEEGRIDEFPEPKTITEEIQAEVEAEVAEEMQLESELVPADEESKELSEEEKRQKFIQAVKESHLRYKPKKHFGVAYKAERKRKNKAQRKSRKLNR
jgi:uncharacterized membrane protein YgaE (UPF0421/DUF939 family)